VTTWDYRIIRYADGRGYGLHETYYDENGAPIAMTADPISFSTDASEGPNAIYESLRTALSDAENRPILDESEFGGLESNEKNRP
jgi:hypothetical protein